MTGTEKPGLKGPGYVGYGVCYSWIGRPTSMICIGGNW